MIWATLLLFIISGYVAGKLFLLANKRGRLKYIGLTISTALLTIMQLTIFIDFLSTSSDITAAMDFIVEWGHVTSLAFVLSSLAIFIRESKPVFAQFPISYTALPLLIIISYLLVEDTYALKTWLITIYQGGAILVALLMYSVYTYRKNEYFMILAGVILFLMSYVLFWNLSGSMENYLWTWKILVGIAMVISLYGYEKTEIEAPKTTF